MMKKNLTCLFLVVVFFQNTLSADEKRVQPASTDAGMGGSETDQERKFREQAEQMAMERRHLPINAEADRWKFVASMPGWMPSLVGNVGINALISKVDLDPGDLIRRYDMVASLRTEASLGRYGIMSSLLYTSLSDGIGSDTVVQKIDLQVDMTIAELAMRWRVIDNARGSLDLYAGARYTNLFQQGVTQANTQRIGQVSTALVNNVSERIRNNVANLGLREMVADEFHTRVEGIDPGRPGEVPIGPIGGRLAERLRERIEEILISRQDELRARVDAVKAAVGAAQVAAQARLDALKNEISASIASEAESLLNSRAARTDAWWDPFIGLRARYNFNDRFYATAMGDIGGFGVGSRLSWQAEAALGCHITKNFFAEIGYRAFGTDYFGNGLTYDVIMHGAQITMGFEF